MNVQFGAIHYINSKSRDKVKAAVGDLEATQRLSLSAITERTPGQLGTIYTGQVITNEDAKAVLNHLGVKNVSKGKTVEANNRLIFSHLNSLYPNGFKIPLQQAVVGYCMIAEVAKKTIVWATV